MHVKHAARLLLAVIVLLSLALTNHPVAPWVIGFVLVCWLADLHLRLGDCRLYYGIGLQVEGTTCYARVRNSSYATSRSWLVLAAAFEEV